MADSTGLLLLGGVAVFGVLYLTGALCQADIANGALCPPASITSIWGGQPQGVWQGPETGRHHMYPHGGRHTAGGGYQPGGAGPPQGTGYSDDGGYGDDSGYGDDYSSYQAHISIA